MITRQNYTNPVTHKGWRAAVRSAPLCSCKNYKIVLELVEVMLQIYKFYARITTYYLAAAVVTFSSKYCREYCLLLAALLKGWRVVTDTAASRNTTYTHRNF